jgi:hypothetical protein
MYIMHSAPRKTRQRRKRADEKSANAGHTMVRIGSEVVCQETGGETGRKDAVELWRGWLAADCFHGDGIVDHCQPPLLAAHPCRLYLPIDLSASAIKYVHAVAANRIYSSTNAATTPLSLRPL